MPRQLPDPIYHFSSDSSSYKKTIVEEVRTSEAIPVSSLNDLIKMIAEISHANNLYELYYRGQDSDYKENGKSSILPSIFRGLSDGIDEYQERHDRMTRYQQLMLRRSGGKGSFKGSNEIQQNAAVRIAYLQHYCGFEFPTFNIDENNYDKDLITTPVLDLTTSLNVGISFAFTKYCEDSKEFYFSRKGFLFVLGIPRLEKSIRPFRKERMIITQLKSVCSPYAFRPFFQEGIGASEYPIPRRNINIDNLEHYDFSKRLIAKFELTRGERSGFDRILIPVEYLHPNEDSFKHYLRILRMDAMN